MSSELEDLMWERIIAAGLPRPERELVFIRGRRFRFDFAWPCGLALECDGMGVSGHGGGAQGGHQTIVGSTRDRIKDAIAASTPGGKWSVVRVTRRMIESGAAVLILEDRLAQRRAIPRRAALDRELRAALGIPDAAGQPDKPKAKPKVKPKEPDKATSKPLDIVAATPSPTMKTTEHKATKVACDRFLGADLSRYGEGVQSHVAQWIQEVLGELQAYSPSTRVQVIVAEAETAKRRGL